MKATLVLAATLLVCQAPALASAPALKAAAKTQATTKPAPKAAAQDDADTSADAARIAEAQSIIDEIKKQNPPDNFHLKVMLGIMQLVTSSTEAVGLGSGDTTMAVALDGVYHLFGNFGVEAREVYSQNLLPDSTSINQGSAYMSWFDAGPRYTFYLDSTHLDDNIVVKLFYHDNYNNLKLNSPSALFVNYYQGFSASFERNIPITSRLGINGSFDLLQIVNTSSPSVNLYDGTMNTVAKSGYGFQIQAEIYYKFLFNNLPARLGVEYWQQGNQSVLDDSLKQGLGAESYFQVTRAIFGTMSVLF